MKQLKLTLLTFLNGLLQKRINRIQASLASSSSVTPAIAIAPEYAFHSLSPVADADPEGEYAKTLNWALTNRKKEDIKNLAITGPYGSGKSSILKTFQANNTNPDFSFLNISLATFKEETQNPDSPKGADLLRLIELSVLQQIFYHEEDHKIPDSRFKKIKSFGRKKLWYLSTGLFLLLIATLHLLKKNLLESLVGYEFYPATNVIITVLSILIVIVGYFYIIFKSIRTISSITVSKLNIHDAEIEINKNISKSILNNHLDELLYFFEVTDYTVVIIEDLDRFEQTEIFTKLRELNLLLNYSDKIKRDIVFIYAVRDDMFKDKDRTKFFDFIIPVIPVINSSNSNEKLMDVVKKNGYKIKPELIENISLFIDDMRLLYNITNEYYIYRKKLGKLDPNKLMSIVVYKNIYPNDFVDLSNGEGQLHGVFNKKSTFINERLKVIDDQIIQAKTKIDQIENILFTDGQELRMLYVLKYVEKLSGITHFTMNGDTCSISDAANEDNFKFLMENTAIYHFYQHNRNYGGNLYTPTSDQVPHKFKDIEKEIDPDNTYLDRLALADDWNNDKVQVLKAKIAELEGEKIKIRQFKIKDIMALGGCKMDLENKKQLQLVNILLRNGYIGEDYLDYLSIFYEGSITKEDREFLLNVKAQIKSEFDYQLYKLDKLIPKIDTVDFTQDYILNYDLTDYVLTKPSTNKNQKSAILAILKNESENSVTFIDGFIEKSKNPGLFIKELAKNWPNMWHFLSQQSKLSKERLDVFFKHLIASADIADLKILAEHSKLKTDISEMANFLEIDVSKEKVKEVIKGLEIQFTNLKMKDATDELAKFVYENNHYRINENMIRSMLQTFGTYDQQSFNEKNYFAIKESKCESLIQYVDDNLETYITDIHLMLEQNTREDEVVLIDLLNHAKLSIELKTEVIEKTDTKIIDIENIEFEEVAKQLLDSSKLTAKWQNLTDYYQNMEAVLDEHIVGFINNVDNAKELSVDKVNIETPVPDLETVKKFLRAILMEDSINNVSYNLILEAVPYNYPNLALQDLSYEKVKMMIDHNVLTMNVTNYNLLREHFTGLHTPFAIYKRSVFVPAINDYVIEEPEVFDLVSSGKLTVSEKNKVIAAVDDTALTSTTRLSAELGTLSIIHDSLILPTPVIYHILLNELSNNQRLQLLVKRFMLFSKDEVMSILSQLPEPYSEISKPGKRPTLADEQLNWDLTRKLVNADYIKRATDERGKIRISTYKR
ncbi:YobI family P-loop NTPase [Pedobacter panaciterrae]